VPVVLGHLVDDAFGSLNGFFLPRRGTQFLRWITCAFTDLDLYNVGLSVEEGVELVLDVESNFGAPSASMLYASGRGLWAFWFLREGGQPVRAWPEKVASWKRLQATILERFARFLSRVLAILRRSLGSKPGEEAGRRFKK
jgi:hypothetical protein